MRKECPICDCQFECSTSQKLCSDECREESEQARQSSAHARHVALLRVLDAERCPQTDMLRNENFYAALLEFDPACTYCRGPLGKTGHCLDRIRNDEPHWAGNVCPACPTCNRIRSNQFSFEEMVDIIGPAIAEVRHRRARK